MVGLIEDIDETIDLDGLFDLLEIEIDDFTIIGEYFLYLLSNLEIEDEELLEKVGFEKVADGLFLTTENPIQTERVLEYLMPIYIEQEKELWSGVIDKINLLNNKILSFGKKCPFNPTIEHYKIILNWHGKITDTEDSFKSFINDLNKLFRESCKKNKKWLIEKKYRKHKFWECVYSLRDFYFHDISQRNEEQMIKAVKRANEAFKKLVTKESPNSKLPFDFINLQLNLIKSCIDFLDELEGWI